MAKTHVELLLGAALRAESQVQAAQRRSGGMFMPQRPPAEAVAIDAALRELDFEVLDEISLSASDTPAARRRAVPGVADSAAQIRVALEADEAAVLLTQDDGLYRWVQPSSRAPDPAAQAARRRGGTAAGAVPDVATFDLDLAQPVSPRSEGATRRSIGSWFGNVRVWVLRFAAQRIADATVAKLEQHVDLGLVEMRGAEPQQWERRSDLGQWPLPQDRPLRVLLFVHGTFSSTAGSFGALALSTFGRALLDRLHAHYDAVIGYDHPTLSVDPLDNARDLLARLRALRSPHAVVFDVVCYSRGGLVFRSLSEHLLAAASGWNARFDRVVFVGCTNAGTELARPENWNDLIDLYTSVTAAATRLLAGLAPGAQFPAELLSAALKGLGALVKYTVQVGVSERRVPGIAAMEASGAFVAEINQTQAGQVTPDRAQYFAIRSNFDPRLAAGSGFGRRLALWTGDRIVDRLMRGAANDLVVNTDSMVAIDASVGGFVKDFLDFPQHAEVFHTVYFTRPETCDALARWLRVPALVEGARPARRTADGQPARSPGTAPEPPMDLPISVDTHFLLIDAQTSCASAFARLRQAEPPFVIVRRTEPGVPAPYLYAYSLPEILSRPPPRDERIDLRQFLDLHEGGVSPLVTPGELQRHGTMNESRRQIAMHGPTPLGVVRASTDFMRNDLVVARYGYFQAGPPPQLDPDGLQNFAVEPEPPVGPQIQTQNAAPPGDERAAFAPAPAPAPAPPAPPPPSATPAKVVCHFRAEMPDELRPAQHATLEVTVAREEIERARRRGADQASSGAVDTARKITVDLFPRLNVLATGDERADIDVPAPGTPAVLLFDIQIADGVALPAEFEVQIGFRQGNHKLALLTLRGSVVVARSATPRRLDSHVTHDASLAPPCGHHLLMVEEQELPGEMRYRYQLIAPDNQPLPVGELSEKIRTRRDEYVAGILARIEDAWSGLVAANLAEDARHQAFLQDLQDIGVELFEELIPLGLRVWLAEHWNEIGAIHLYSREPFVPWEIMHVKHPAHPLQPGAPTRFLAERGLLRWLQGQEPPPTQFASRAVRHVVPGYPAGSGYELPAIQQETAMLASLGAQPVEPTRAAVYARLADSTPLGILHFAGHGESDSARPSDSAFALAVSADGQGQWKASEPLEARAIRSRADLRPAGRPLVFFNACRVARQGFLLTGVGGFPPAFIEKGAGAFVAPLWMVDDDAAQRFIAAFYAAFVASGKSLAESRHAAIQAARTGGGTRGDASWLAYAVYGHPCARMARA